MQEYLNASSICLTKGNIPNHLEIELPASKSIANRLLILQNLSKKKVEITNLSLANDALLLKDVLEANQKKIDVEDAGTTARFSLAWACIKNTTRKIVGSARLQERPMSELIIALRELGFNIECNGKEGFFPVTVFPVDFLKLGNSVKIDASKSSQFISALCLIAPFLPDGLHIEILGNISSKPYITMTLALLGELGVEISNEKNNIRIESNPGLEGNFEVEADWSAAAFWYEMATLLPKTKITLRGLRENSIQGDSRAVGLFQKIGVHSIFDEEGVKLLYSEDSICVSELDFNDTPDLAQPFIWACALNKIPLVLNGLQTLVNKETDRILALQNELKKIDSKLNEVQNEYQLSCGISSISSGLNFETYKDHRMAMAVAATVLVSNSIYIENPKVVTKSYPGFWNELKKFGIKITV